MEKTYSIDYARAVMENDLPMIGKAERARIKSAIETKLKTQPDLFGKPLRKPMAGYWDLRVGNYRVIYRIGGSLVLVFVIMHRNMEYDTKFQKVIRRRD